MDHIYSYTQIGDLTVCRILAEWNLREAYRPEALQWMMSKSSPLDILFSQLIKGFSLNTHVL